MTGRRDWLKKAVEAREEMQDDETTPALKRAADPALTQEKPAVEKGRKKKPKKTKEVKLVGKSSDPDYRQVAAYIRKETHDAAIIQLITEGRKRDFSDLVQDLLDAWVKK